MLEDEAKTSSVKVRCMACLLAKAVASRACLSGVTGLCICCPSMLLARDRQPEGEAQGTSERQLQDATPQGRDGR